MKNSFIMFAVLVLMAATVVPMPANAQSAFPRMTGVTPNTGVVGDELVAEGENLDAKLVKSLYLTDGENDVKIVIIDQTATSIKFKIPDEAEPGSYRLMVLTREKEPRLIEQPVRVTVE